MYVKRRSAIIHADYEWQFFHAVTLKINRDWQVHFLFITTKMSCLFPSLCWMNKKNRTSESVIRHPQHHPPTPGDRFKSAMILHCSLEILRAFTSSYAGFDLPSPRTCPNLNDQITMKVYSSKYNLFCQLYRNNYTCLNSYRRVYVSYYSTIYMDFKS